MQTVMVIEDDEETLKLLEVMLKRGGYIVHTATDADRALTALDQVLPDLIVLDLMLPVTDGIVLCKAIRNRPETHDTPILVLTAKSDPISIQQSLEAGANAYVVKPVSLKDLLDNVSGLLAATQQTANPC